MKIRTNTIHIHGGALIITLFIAIIMGIAMASYLGLVSQQNLSVTRAQAWNGCIPVLEAGIEEALTQIHYNGITNLSANGWAMGSDGSYHKSGSLGDGSYYETSIEPVNPPVIVSAGYVPVPLAPSSQLGASGSTSQPSPRHVARRVRVNTSLKGMFSKAMLAKGSIVFSGSARTDSFDPTDPKASTNGRYDPPKAGDKGDVASNGTVLKTFVGSSAVDIRGHLSTGPGATINLSGGSSIGGTAWHQAGNTGVQPGWFADDMNVDIPDVQVPFTSGYYTHGSGVVDGTNYAFVIGSGNHKLSQFVLGMSQKAIVTGNAVLHVTEKMNISGAAQLIIAPGASLRLYNGAASGSISGNGVANQTGSAANFIYYGLPTNTSLDMSGNSGFIGAIYAPNADLTMSGGAATGFVDFTGASVSKTVTMSGARSFHYDESLGRLFTSFVVTAWNEI
jgi:hypothetical protein